MKRRFHEGELSIPDTWTDETLLIIKSSEAEGINLVVSRDRIPTGADPDAHLESQRKMFADSLPDFKQSTRTIISVAGKPCVAVEYSWRSPEGVVHQLNLMRAVGGTQVCFTFTATTPFTDAHLRGFHAILRSFVPDTDLDRVTT